MQTTSHITWAFFLTKLTDILASSYEEKHVEENLNCVFKLIDDIHKYDIWGSKAVVNNNDLVLPQLLISLTHFHMRLPPETAQ